MGIRDLMHMIFGGGEPPKNPKLYQREKPSKHWGSKKRYNKQEARTRDKRARNSRKANR